MRYIFFVCLTLLSSLLYAQGPEFSVTPISLSFAAVQIDSSEVDSVVVTNTGDDSLHITAVTSDNIQFLVSPGDTVLDALESATYYITYQPTTMGAVAANIIFTSDAPSSTDSLPVDGVGVAPLFTFSSSSISFGNVLVNSTKEDSVVVRNTGTSSLAITTVSSDNSDFEITPTNADIEIADSVVFYVTYQPSVSGIVNANVIFVSNAESSSDTLAVDGTGVAPVFSASPSSFDYGEVLIGATKADSVMVKNTGTSLLTISSVASDETEYSISPTNATIAAGDSLEFAITFEPTAAGIVSSSIVFEHDAESTPDTIEVTGTGIAPIFSASPSSIAFDDILLGENKIDSIIVINTGSAELTISSVTSDNTTFEISHTSVTLGVSESDTFYITFTPTSPSLEEGNIIFVNDGESSPDSVSVSGTGITPGFEVSQTTISFGDVFVGGSAEDSVVVYNTGNTTLNISSVVSESTEFSITPNDGMIDPDDSLTFYITFTPEVFGAIGTNIIFEHNGTSSPDTVMVDGVGMAPEFTGTPENLDFGDVYLGDNKVDSIIVKNTGTVELEITEIVSDNSDFNVSVEDATVSPSDSLILYITYTPSGLGTSNGNIVFTHDASSSPDTITVEGVGVEPEFDVTPSSLSFDEVNVGSSFIDSVIVTNIGTGELLISSVLSQNNTFSVTPSDASIAASESEKFYITFTPDSAQLEEGNIIFTHNGSSSPDVVTVDGIGVAPQFTLSTTNLDYASVLVGTTIIDSVEVSNSGTSALIISSITSTNADFSVLPPDATIEPLESEVFYISFSPTVMGDRTGSIIFSHDAGSSPDTVNVTGVGIAPVFTQSEENILFGNVLLGLSKVDSLLIRNTGTATLNIGSVGSDNSEFDITPKDAIIDVDDSLWFVVTFTPTSTGSKSGNIEFTHDAAGSPNVLYVSGNVVDYEFVLSTTSVSFGDVVLPGSKLDTIIVENVSETPITISEVLSDNPEFSVSPSSGVLEALSVMEFYLTFTPTSIGAKTGSISFTHDASTSPDSVDVSGSGIDTLRFRTFAPDVSLSEKLVKIKFRKSKIVTQPNIATALNNVFQKVDKKAGAVFLGIPHTTKADLKKYAWIVFKRSTSGNNLGKLYTSAHDGQSYPLDSSRVAGKKTRKLKKALVPTRKKYNNIAIEQGVAFNLNLRASSDSILPYGFGSLVLDTPYTLIGKNLQGLTLREVGSAFDTVMTYWDTLGIKSQTMYDSIGQFSEKILRRINNAFAAAIDTTNYSIDTAAVKKNPYAIRLKGTKTADQIGILKRVISKGGDLNGNLSFEEVPSNYILYQNYPNPFNPSTTIRFYLEDDGLVFLKIYDVLGREIKNLIAEERDAGEHEVVFDATDIPSGIYFYRLSFQNGATNFSTTQKMLLIK
ncbi:MAG: choice-of-anchor D domain-containing protein [Ignavibacteriales bacterium]|nr:choice-of-anchor D domain-containing protein [Ignavibacteriales bacterium]